MYQLVPRVPGFLGCPVSPVRRNMESNHKRHVVNSVEEIKFKFKFKFIYSHLYNYNTFLTTIRKKEEVKTELTIH